MQVTCLNMQLGLLQANQGNLLAARWQSLAEVKKAVAQRLLIILYPHE